MNCLDSPGDFQALVKRGTKTQNNVEMFRLWVRSTRNRCQTQESDRCTNKK